jgi:serine/threonine protein kinase
MAHLKAHERRIARRLEARGLAGLGETLARLDGTRFGERFTLERLFAAGAEGAVFLARDESDPPGAVRCVAKIPLLLYHRPISLDSEGIRRRRAALREEGRQLEESGSQYMPKSLGVHDMMNPLLDAARGGAFAEPEPVLVMERLPGHDLDVWLARMHSSDVDVRMLRRTLDAVAVAVLQGLWDLQEHGFYYADLRPGNVRIGGRDRRARLLDAGSLVLRTDCTGKFPHVPAYLPPDLFVRIRSGVDRPFPTAAVQAVMAGRTLYEVATGRVPMPGEPVDLPLLWDSRVSRPVADTIDGLCSGSFSDVRQALRYLHKHAVKRRPTALQPAGVAAAPRLELEPPPPPPPVFVAPVVVPARRRSENDEILPPSKRKTSSWWRRLLGR